MEKEFVSYEQALALKKLGFDEPCFGFYELGNIDIYYDTILQRQNHKFRNNTQLNFYGDLTEKISAPIFSQAFRWFREKYEYWSYIKEATKGTCRFNIEKFDENFFTSGLFGSYDEAESACIDKLIEIIKKK
jgi:hypothetical protein